MASQEGKYIASRSRCPRKTARPSVVYIATAVKSRWRRRPIAQNRALSLIVSLDTLSTVQASAITST